jgi:hypothetical protein
MAVSDSRFVLCSQTESQIDISKTAGVALDVFSTNPTRTFCLVPILSAQDAVKVDPKHSTVVSENDQVRILKVHYGPHEKSVMHSHFNTVAVFLNDSKGRFSFPDGKTEDLNG